MDRESYNEYRKWVKGGCHMNNKLQKTILLGVCTTLISSFVITGCSSTDITNAAPDTFSKEEKVKNESVIDNEIGKEVEIIENLVKNFGDNLKMVSLLAPEDMLRESMEKYYGQFISESLLEKWLKEPSKALGRLTSSPWPEGIDVLNIEKLSKDQYRVEGQVIEVTSQEMDKNEAFNKYDLILIVKFDGDKWIIDEVLMEESNEEVSLVYENKQYNFQFYLPDTWEGYSIVEDQWKGVSLVDSADEKLSGPIIIIRHPQWTEDSKRQDIPIMIFTTDQWEALQKGEFSVGAAPVGPKELGSNSKYVFALPARYNYEFLEGYEKVEAILESNPLKVIE